MTAPLRRYVIDIRPAESTENLFTFSLKRQGGVLLVSQFADAIVPGLARIYEALGTDLSDDPID